MQGINLRIRTAIDGMSGRAPKEVYKGWRRITIAEKNAEPHND